MRRSVGVVVGVAVAVAAGAWIYRADKPAPRDGASAIASRDDGDVDRPGPIDRTSSGAPLASAPTTPRAPGERGAAATSPGILEAAEADASDTLVAVRAAIKDESAASTEVLMRAIDSDDSVARLEAIDELVRRKHVAAVKPLLKLDPADDPFVGPTALLALGRLGHEAGGGTAEATVTRLSKLLEAEKARQGVDSPGNILLIFEALGHTKTASAAQVLERELVAPEHGTAARVAIVDAIEACGQRTSTQALEAFREAFQLVAIDPFERELEKDLVAAVERALASLGR
ncbi:MAG: hypothetical protein KF894_02945 [Labilithrix sp.]|nr:hypothetical protein [Labilithrix sp.]